MGPYPLDLAALPFLYRVFRQQVEVFVVSADEQEGEGQAFQPVQGFAFILFPGPYSTKIAADDDIVVLIHLKLFREKIRLKPHEIPMCVACCVDHSLSSPYCSIIPYPARSQPRTAGRQGSGPWKAPSPCPPAGGWCFPPTGWVLPGAAPWRWLPLPSVGRRRNLSLSAPGGRSVFPWGRWFLPGDPSAGLGNQLPLLHWQPGRSEVQPPDWSPPAFSQCRQGSSPRRGWERPPSPWPWWSSRWACPFGS